MQQWEDVVVAIAGTDTVEVSIGHEVGLGLIQPEPVEPAAANVVAKPVPVPLARLGIGAVDQGAGTVAALGQAVYRLAVLVGEQPTLGCEIIEVARFSFEARPDADDGVHALRVQLPIHRLRVREGGGIDIELAHASPVKPVYDHDVERVTA